MSTIPLVSGMPESVASIRSQLAMEQATLTILAQHCRDRDEVFATHKIEHAGELLRAAFDALDGALRLERAESGFFIDAREVEP